MVETVFENRFQHLEEMRRMGLHSEIIRDTARIVGGQPLQEQKFFQRPSCQCSFDFDRFGSTGEKLWSVSGSLG